MHVRTILAVVRTPSDSILSQEICRTILHALVVTVKSVMLRTKQVVKTSSTSKKTGRAYTTALLCYRSKFNPVREKHAGPGRRLNMPC
jgi:hypothetical protein